MQCNPFGGWELPASIILNAHTAKERDKGKNQATSANIYTYAGMLFIFLISVAVYHLCSPQVQHFSC